MMIFSGLIGVKEQAAQIVIINISGILFMVALGLLQALSSLVGSDLGRGDVASAKRYFSITR